MIPPHLGSHLMRWLAILALALLLASCTAKKEETTRRPLPRQAATELDAPAPGLDAVTREVFAQLGEEYFELCERLFAQDSDFSLT